MPVVHQKRGKNTVVIHVPGEVTKVVSVGCGLDVRKRHGRLRWIIVFMRLLKYFCVLGKQRMPEMFIDVYFSDERQLPPVITEFVGVKKSKDITNTMSSNRRRGMKAAFLYR
jgi:hypothetical protein